LLFKCNLYRYTAVSGIFCLGQRVWRDPSVAAAAAALTDTYWWGGAR
jgi:hypothetical protein